MSSRLVTGLMLSCCLMTCFLAEAQDAKKPSELYAEAITAYFAKDYNSVESVLSVVIDNGTSDPRTYYVRGLSRFASGNIEAAEIDFEAGARLEFIGLSRVNVPRSLERIQGPARQLLETFRRLARRSSEIAAGSFRKDRALQQLYADGKAAVISDKDEVAVSVLDLAVSNGSTDPRVFYFRGLAKQKLGLSSDAAVDFQRAVGLELHPGNRIDVDFALESVQGEMRVALEKHRHEAISIARLIGDQERQQMIAALIEQRAADSAAGGNTGGAVASSAIIQPPAQTPPLTVATTTPPSRSTGGSPASTGSTADAGTAVNLAWLPADSEVIVHLRIRDLWSSPMLTALKETPEIKGGLQMLQDELHLSPGDIDSVTISINGAAELAMVGAANPSALATGTDKLVAVIRTRVPFDQQVVVERTDDFEAATHDDKTYYRAMAAGEMPCVYMPDSRTIVLADEEPLTLAITQGADAVKRPEFDFLDSSRHVGIAFVPNDPFSLTESIPTAGSGSDALDRLGAALKDQLLGVALGISLTDSLELDVRVLCVDDAAATEVSESLGDLMNEAKGMWALAKGAVPPPIAGVVDSIIRAQKNSASSNVATISTRVSQQSIERAVASAEEMLPMLMMGAMAGLGGAMGSGGDLVIGDGSGQPPAPPNATKPAESLTIKTSARMSTSIELDDDGNEKPKAIELVLDISGAQAKSASGAGFASVTSAKDNNDSDLTVRVVANFGQGGFESIDRDDFFIKHPDDGCRVLVTFNPPAQAATEIAAAEGIVKLRIVENSSQIIVDNAKGLLGKEIDNAELIAAGYQLKLEEKREKFGDEEFVSWRLEWVNAASSKLDIRDVANGGGIGLQVPELVDGDGNVINAFSNTEFTSFGKQGTLAWGMSVQEDQPVPDGARLRFTINSEVSVVDVAFKAQNVAISAEDSGF